MKRLKMDDQTKGLLKGKQPALDLLNQDYNTTDKVRGTLKTKTNIVGTPIYLFDYALCCVLI
jgi:hypothetical protein